MRTSPHPCDYKANICPDLNVGRIQIMTRGIDVVAVFVQKHPEELRSPLIRQELADLISIALTEAFQLGERTMIKTIIGKLEKEVRL